MSLESTAYRHTVDLADFGLPEVPMVGVNNQLAAAAAMREHAHPGIMEICYLKRGRQDFTVGGRSFPVQGREIFLTFPDELHGTGSSPFSRAILYWMQIVIPAPGEPFLLLDAQAVSPLVERLLSLPSRHFRVGEAVEAGFERVLAIVRRRPDPITRLSLATAVVEWLVAVVGAAEAPSSEEPSGDIAQVVGIIEKNLDGRLPIDELARCIHLSTSRFKAKFRRQVGMPPGEYVLRRKIARAEKLIRETDVPITEIALALGFSSSQHFATTFRKFTNRRPRDLRMRTEEQAGPLQE